MQYIITETDKMLIQQANLQSTIRISILSSDNKTLGVLNNLCPVQSLTVDAESTIRRTTSISIPLSQLNSSIEKIIESYLNLEFLFEVGIYNIRENDYIYYKLGTYCIAAADTSYDAVTNTLSLSLSDRFAKLDGTRNGQVGGAPTISIPVENEDGTKNTIKSSMISIIKSETTIKDFIIEDVGEYYGMPQNNVNYIKYRQLNPDWNILPYDLTFNCGCAVSDLLLELKNLYPNCQLYFDIYGNLCFNMIPSNNTSPIILSNDYLQSIIIADNSESVQYEVDSFKNVVEIFGKTYDVDRFSQTSSFLNDTYIFSLESYDTYQVYDCIAFSSCSVNSNQSYININNIGKIPLYNEYTTTFIAENTISTGDMVVIKIFKDSDNNYFAYYLGQYQPHALCVLTNNINDIVYSKKYFSQTYNCLEKNIAFVEVKDSAFSIQKLGIILDSKSGDLYDNIISDSVALENAKYEIYKSSVWNDTITIVTKLCPWLDVNIKVEYKKQQQLDGYVYIIKNIVHDFINGTSSITMYRFSSLYQE